MIVIIDYGMGNLGSIANMLRKIGADAVISSAAADIRKAEKLILPGVGAFDNGMKNLRDRGLLPVLQDRVLSDKVPLLGICLGMQLLTKNSEEGTLDGLGWIDARTVRFKFSEEAALKVPHMGWNQIVASRDNPLTRNIGERPRFYFVHSYYVVCDRNEDVLTTTHYGYDFTSAVNRGNIYGVQFHPEKSHTFGMKLLKNFAELA